MDRRTVTNEVKHTLVGLLMRINWVTGAAPLMTEPDAGIICSWNVWWRMQGKEDESTSLVQSLQNAIHNGQCCKKCDSI